MELAGSVMMYCAEIARRTKHKADLTFSIVSALANDPVPVT